jgi:protein BCP1
MKRKAADLQEVSRDEAEEDLEDQTSHSNSDSFNSSGTSGSDDSSSDSESEGNEEVDVDFEFFDPQEVDFHGLKALLQTFLDGSPYNCSELVNTVIKQVHMDV